MSCGATGGDGAARYWIRVPLVLRFASGLARAGRGEKGQAGVDYGMESARADWSQTTQEHSSTNAG